ncbi:thiamine diphosphokinase [Virgibacillus profundi]|uniref:Thiamine diphosphokinase n=1 Tax=Virgibacillus profundi TaxID=2024555 RepID=A0A2A2IEA3_9BACI|nr:thiamine diphosphokinase [Virgibacillus profundi]PAV29957.1 thiamine diphosphokinase [Virgibacillus profundi]PXY54129.1 thiamine diphosphokinase [Virgibacillus profundi]
MLSVAIVGNGPIERHPDFQEYKNVIDIWIGADRGALTLVTNEIPIEYAVGDFDSINEEEKKVIQQNTNFFKEYPSEKNETDLEIALLKAYELDPDEIYLFGVTGGRLDHELINIQLLSSIVNKGIRGVIADSLNQLELTTPGMHTINYCEKYPYISFIPFTKEVSGITLSDFYYPLENQTISWGSTLCISNKLLSKSGTFSYKEGILLLVKSRDTIQR